VITHKNEFEKSKKMYLNHKLKLIYTYKYDINSNLVVEKEFSHQDTLNYLEKTNFIYNDENQLIFRENTSGINNNTYILEFTYDSFGNILSEKHTENGNCIEKRSYRNEYLYDIQNNWIKRTTYSLNGQVKYVLEREFEYYN
jgi:YD repeat-containing protein